jgi:hypothetical protein
MQMDIRDPHLPSGVSIIERPVPAASMPCIDKPSMDRDPHIMQLARILHCRWRLIVTIAVLGAMLAGITGFLVAPKYTATAQIVVEAKQDGPIGSQADVPRPTDESAIDTHVTMLASHDHLRRVLDSLSDRSDSAAASDQAPTERNPAGLSDGSLPQPAAANGVTQPTDTMNTALSFDELGRRTKLWLGSIARGGSAASREFDELDRSWAESHARADLSRHFRQLYGQERGESGDCRQSSRSTLRQWRSRA